MCVLANRWAWATSFSLVVLCTSSRVAAVQYEVEFDATWSSSTHPGAYPIGAHFSPLVGATHNDQVSFWDVGANASPGMEQMAETGARSTLQAEFLDAGGDTATIILGNGINSPGLTTKAFDIQPSHSYVTLVTMIAPSPDWFAGVSAFNLRNGNAWMSEVTVGLFACDAGTDSGPSFTSPNADTNPQIPIALLGTPFSDTPPLGTFTFTLLTSLSADFDGDGDVDGDDFLAWQGGFGTPASAQKSDGDYDDDGDVDGDDFLGWQSEFGSGSGSASLAVPEPTSMAVVFVIVVGMLFRRGRIDRLSR